MKLTGDLGECRHEAVGATAPIGRRSLTRKGGTVVGGKRIAEDRAAAPGAVTRQIELQGSCAINGEYRRF